MAAQGKSRLQADKTQLEGILSQFQQSPASGTTAVPRQPHISVCKVTRTQHSQRAVVVVQEHSLAT